MKRGRQLIGRCSLLGVWLALLGASYLLGTAMVSAAPGPLPVCQQCDCKEGYAWKNISDDYASGMQTQGATPSKIKSAIGALEAKICPDPPNVALAPANDTPTVDRYEYQNPAITCTDNPAVRSTVQEADVTGSGTRVAIGVARQICVN